MAFWYILITMAIKPNTTTASTTTIDQDKDAIMGSKDFVRFYQVKFVFRIIGNHQRRLAFFQAAARDGFYMK
jgi:hypothetical protein